MRETTQLEPQFLTATQVSERIINVHPRTLKRAQARGDIKGHFLGGKWWFDRESVLAWISGEKVSAVSAAGPVTPTGLIPSGKRPRGRPRKVRQKEASI